jgi:hypothetical protein
MDVIISEKQKERIKSTIKEIVEGINVPLAMKVVVEIIEDGTIYVLIPLKNYLGSTSRTRYESLIRNKVSDLIGLKVEVIMMERSTGIS